MVESQRPRVSGTQLSCASVGDQLAIIGQVARGMTGQGPIDERTQHAAGPAASEADKVLLTEKYEIKENDPLEQSWGRKVAFACSWHQAANLLPHVLRPSAYKPHIENTKRACLFIRASIIQHHTSIIQVSYTSSCNSRAVLSFVMWSIYSMARLLQWLCSPLTPWSLKTTSAPRCLYCVHVNVTNGQFLVSSVMYAGHNFKKQIILQTLYDCLSPPLSAMFSPSVCLPFICSKYLKRHHSWRVKLYSVKLMQS